MEPKLLTYRTIMEKFVEDSKAEALDEDGVWYACTIVRKEIEAITVAFDSWSSEWNRWIKIHAKLEMFQSLKRMEESQQTFRER